MNWRTLLFIVFWTMASYAMSLTMYETIIGGIIVLIIAWVSKQALSAIGNIAKKQMFSICFVDHDPPGSTETPLGTFHEMPLGLSPHWVKVVIQEGLGLDEFNLRFLSNEEAAKNPKGNSPEDIRSIVSINIVAVTPEILAQGISTIPTPDRHGGVDMKLIPAYPWGTSLAMFFKIEVDAKQIWSGKISFRANDKDLHPRYARTDVRIIESKLA